MAAGSEATIGSGATTREPTGPPKAPRRIRQGDTGRPHRGRLPSDDPRLYRSRASVSPNRLAADSGTTGFDRRNNTYRVVSCNALPLPGRPVDVTHSDLRGSSMGGGN